jgi:hypothetical protein
MRLASARGSVVLGIIGALYFLTQFPTYALEIRADETGAILWQQTLCRTQTLTLRYIHSINKRPVEEIFRATDDGLLLTGVVYDSFGVGMPTEPDPGATLSLDYASGKIRITGMTRRFAPLRLRVGSVAEQELILGAQRFRLDALAPPTTLLALNTSRAFEFWICPLHDIFAFQR